VFCRGPKMGNRANTTMHACVHRVTNTRQIYLLHYVKAFRKERSITGENTETKQMTTKPT